jgi:hypothetical protein
MISADQSLFEKAKAALATTFSDVDIASEVMDFDFTHYYDQELGSPLYRQFVSFSKPVKPGVLAAVKVATNQMEADFASAQSSHQGRVINLDPGYLDESKLILASMKNFSHRIYLDQGVYAELTLMYHKGHWDSLQWTFPDYASGRYHPFLTQVRMALREHLQACRANRPGLPLAADEENLT